MSVLSIALVAALSIAGTIAYLTYEDSDVNVMTLGNVKIEQHEYERDLNEDGSFKTDTIDNQTSYVLKEFSQAKPLLPSALVTNGNGWGWESTTVRMSQVDSYGGMKVFVKNSNAQDKFVTVENTGKSDAYVRTLVAIEVGDASPTLIGTNSHLNAWERTAIGVVEIDGNNYYLYEFVYKGAQLSDGSYRHANGILPAGDTTYPSFAQVYLNSQTTNEDCEALDGNGNGTLDILVLSQAVQTAGFDDAKTALDTAFGNAKQNADEWFGDETVPTVVLTHDELNEAMKIGGTIVIGKDIVIEEMIEIPAGIDVYLNMNGKTLNTAKADPAIKMFDNTDLVIDGNGTFDIAENTDANLIWPNGDVESSITIKNGTFVRNPGTNVKDYNFPFIVGNETCTVVIEDGYFDGGYYKEGDCYGICRSNMNKSEQPYVIYGGTFVGQNPAWGVEGKGAACPHCDKDGTSCQGTFLEGQKTTDAGIPSTYTIIEGVTADGRPTYTVSYNK